MDPAVSIIIPCYNSAKTIQRAIHSVIAQDFEQWELIIINDGSSDNSLEVIRQIEDNRIKVIDQVNKGASAARNRGITESKGKWVCFLDSDDILTPYALKVLLSETKDDMDIVIGSRIINQQSPQSIPPYKSISHDSQHLALACLFYEKQRNIIEKDLFQNEFTDCKINVGAPWAKLYRREMLDTHRIRFNEDLVLHEDTLFNHQAYSNAKSVRLISTPVYCYLDNPDSLTRSQNARYREHCVAAMKQFHLLHPELPEELLYFSLFRILECWNGIWAATHGKLLQRYRQIKQFRNTSGIQELISNMPLKGNVYINQCDKLELFLLKHKLLAILVFFMPVIRKLRKIKNSGF